MCKHKIFPSVVHCTQSAYAILVRTMADERISWQAYEHDFRQKERDWFLIVGILAVALAIVGIIIGNILFSVVIVIAATALILHAKKEPRMSRFELNDRGIIVDNRLYPYKTLETFGIDEEPRPKLIIKSHKALVPLIVISLTSEQKESVRQYLATRLTESDLEEPLLHKIIEHFGI